MKFCYSILFLLCVYQDLSAAEQSIALFRPKGSYTEEGSTTSASGLSLQHTLRNRQNYQELIKENIAKQCAQEFVKRQNQKYIQQVDAYIKDDIQHIDTLKTTQSLPVIISPSTVVSAVYNQGLVVSPKKAELCRDIVETGKKSYVLRHLQQQVSSILQQLNVSPRFQHAFTRSMNGEIKTADTKSGYLQLLLSLDLGFDYYNSVDKAKYATIQQAHSYLALKNNYLEMNQASNAELHRLTVEYLGLKAFYNDSCKDVESAHAHWSDRWNRLARKKIQHNNFGQALVVQAMRNVQAAQRFAITEIKQQTQELFNMGVQDQQGHDLREQGKRLEQSRLDKARHAEQLLKEAEDKKLRKQALIDQGVGLQKKSPAGASKQKKSDKKKKSAAEGSVALDVIESSASRDVIAMGIIRPFLSLTEFNADPVAKSKQTLFTQWLHELDDMLSQAGDRSKHDTMVSNLNKLLPKMVLNNAELSNRGFGSNYYLAQNPVLSDAIFSKYHALEQESVSLKKTIDDLQDSLEQEDLQSKALQKDYGLALRAGDETNAALLLQRLKTTKSSIKEKGAQQMQLFSQSFSQGKICRVFKQFCDPIGILSQEAFIDHNPIIPYTDQAKPAEFVHPILMKLEKDLVAIQKMPSRMQSSMTSLDFQLQIPKFQADGCHAAICKVLEDVLIDLVPKEDLKDFAGGFYHNNIAPYCKGTALGMINLEAMRFYDQDKVTELTSIEDIRKINLLNNTKIKILEMYGKIFHTKK